MYFGLNPGYRSRDVKLGIDGALIKIMLPGPGGAGHDLQKIRCCIGYNVISNFQQKILNVLCRVLTKICHPKTAGVGDSTPVYIVFFELFQSQLSNARRIQIAVIRLVRTV